MIRGAGPWGTGPYRLVAGFSMPEKRSDLVILEANPNYWDKSRLPRLKRIVWSCPGLVEGEWLSFKADMGGWLAAGFAPPRRRPADSLGEAPALPVRGAARGRT